MQKSKKLKISLVAVLTVFFCLAALQCLAQGNRNITNYRQAKHLLEKYVLNEPKYRVTLYCEAMFDNYKNIILPTGFTTLKHKKRAHQLEWEHVVPVENFGRTFTAWRDGDELCVNSKGKPYKGRKCAEKANVEFQYMQADMYNIYPSVGAVNAARSNYNFTLLPHAQSNFGTCPMKIDNRKVEPPEQARGKIARAYLYMEATYPRYKMSKNQRKFMQAWDTMHPVTQEECSRTKRIEELQGNENSIVKSRCTNHSLW